MEFVYRPLSQQYQFPDVQGVLPDRWMPVPPYPALFGCGQQAAQILGCRRFPPSGRLKRFIRWMAARDPSWRHSGQQLAATTPVTEPEVLADTYILWTRPEDPEMQLHGDKWLQTSRNKMRRTFHGATVTEIDTRCGPGSRAIIREQTQAGVARTSLTYWVCTEDPHAVLTVETTIDGDGDHEPFVAQSDLIVQSLAHAPGVEVVWGPQLTDEQARKLAGQ